MLPTRQSPNPLSPYMQFSPSGSSPSAYHRASSSSTAPELDKYLLELLTERQNLSPFVQVLPNCTRLLNQEILRLTSLINSPYGEHDGVEHNSFFSSGGLRMNASPLGSARNISSGGLDMNVWPSSYEMERMAQQASTNAWHGMPGGSGNQFGSVVKKIVQIEVPVHKYPNFNFVGRLIGPRGNSLKRVETHTGCRVFIRGRGSVRDPEKEEKLRDKPGYEHLNEPLHVLIEAELPANVVDFQLNQAREIIKDLLKPVDESQDYYRRRQLRELAMLNGTLREDSPCWSGGSTSSFNSNSGMKRAKTRS